ncbi:unnamed protein product [Caenorhabditis auriculariae]|uniref:Uncharacterized protein n=1 Tax=Caenorhabditis auriculariae TaxID=2777116 RepID=A0A8S1HFK1_9PELO|nr:unnamed protein product [Caenorhabditis auriculariae]
MRRQFASRMYYANDNKFTLKGGDVIGVACGHTLAASQHGSCCKSASAYKRWRPTRSILEQIARGHKRQKEEPPTYGQPLLRSPPRRLLASSSGHLMNYDKRYSPGANDRSYSRQPAQPKSGPEARSAYYGREYPPLRSRSHTNVDADFNERQNGGFYDNRALDRSSRSKSLDNRDALREEVNEDRYGGGGAGVIIPIKREPGRSRTFDYRESPISRPREFEHHQSFDRDFDYRDRHNRDFNRDFTRRSGYEDNRISKNRDPYFPQGGESPKSYSSKQLEQVRRNVDYGLDRGYADDFGRDDFREAGGRGTIATIGGGGGGGGGGGANYRSGSHHRSWHESYGGAHDSSFGPSSGRAITHQPGPYQTSTGRPIRPIQHHRVQCCCFNFVWPPWSVESSAPPQQIYRNI